MEKVLVIRLSSIGDIVLTSPIIRALHDSGREVFLLTRKNYTKLASADSRIQKIFVYEEPDLLQQLRDENFDFIADLHCNGRSRRIVRALGRPASGFDKTNLQKWIAVNFKINRVLSPKHIVHRYFQSMQSMGLSYDGKGLDFFIAPEDAISPEELPPAFRNGFIAVALGAQYFTKTIPVEKLSEILNIADLPVVLLGGQEDRAKGEALGSALNVPHLNWAGQLNIGASASVIRHSVVLLTGDTGLMHIGAALRKPVVSLWGSTIPEFGMYPLFPEGQENLSLIFELKNLSCRPCSKLGFQACPRAHFRCMQNQDASSIARTLNNFQSAIQTH